MKGESLLARRPAAANTRQRFLVDGHVHLHRMFEIEPFLAAAASNFAAAEAPGWLLLAERPDEGAFERLRGFRGSGWSIEDGLEATVLQATYRGRLCLVVIADRQIVTAEALEVLALAHPYDIHRRSTAPPCGGSASGAVPVVPWASASGGAGGAPSSAGSKYQSVVV